MKQAGETREQSGFSGVVFFYDELSHRYFDRKAVLRGIEQSDLSVDVPPRPHAWRCWKSAAQVLRGMYGDDDVSFEKVGKYLKLRVWNAYGEVYSVTYDTKGETIESTIGSTSPVDKFFREQFYDYRNRVSGSWIASRVKECLSKTLAIPLTKGTYFVTRYRSVALRKIVKFLKIAAGPGICFVIPLQRGHEDDIAKKSFDFWNGKFQSFLDSIGKDCNDFGGERVKRGWLNRCRKFKEMKDTLCSSLGVTFNTNCDSVCERLEAMKWQLRPSS